MLAQRAYQQFFIVIEFVFLVIFSVGICARFFVYQYIYISAFTAAAGLIAIIKFDSNCRQVWQAVCVYYGVQAG